MKPIDKPQRQRSNNYWNIKTIRIGAHNLFYKSSNPKCDYIIRINHNETYNIYKFRNVNKPDPSYWNFERVSKPLKSLKYVKGKISRKMKQENKMTAVNLTPITLGRNK